MTNRPTINDLEENVRVAKLDASNLRRIADNAHNAALDAQARLDDAECALSREQDRIDTEHLDALDAAEREQDAV